MGYIDSILKICLPYKEARRVKCYLCGEKELSPKIPRLRIVLLGHYGAYVCYNCVTELKDSIETTLSDYTKLISEDKYSKIVVAEEL